MTRAVNPPLLRPNADTCRALAELAESLTCLGMSARVCTADWHLPPAPRAHGWGGFAETAEDEWAAAHVAVRLTDEFLRLRRDGTAALLVAGDLLDGPRLCSDAAFTLYQMFSGVPVAYCLGNHDGGEDWLGARWSRDIGHAAAFDHDPGFRPGRSAGPRAPVALYHQSFVEFGGRGPWRVADLPTHELAVCGDTHVPKLIAGGDADCPPRWALSPGALVPQQLGEERQGYGLVWVWDAARPADPPRAVPLPGLRRYYTLFCYPGAEDAAVAQAVALAARDRAGGRPPPAVVFRADVFPNGFKATAVRAGELHGFLAGLRLRPPADSRESAPDPAAARAAARRGLAAAVTGWPGLEPGDAELGARLADPAGDPRAVLAAARPV